MYMELAHELVHIKILFERKKKIVQEKRVELRSLCLCVCREKHYDFFLISRRILPQKENFGLPEVKPENRDQIKMLN